MPDSSVVDKASLEAGWALAGRTSASDLTEWVRRLGIEFLMQSPSPIIRQCAVRQCVCVCVCVWCVCVRERERVCVCVSEWVYE